MIYLNLRESICWHDKTKTPDRNDLKLGTIVFLNTLSKPSDSGFKRSGVQGPLAFVFSDCCRTNDEEPMPLTVFIHAYDVVRRRRFASPESEHTPSTPCPQKVCQMFLARPYIFKNGSLMSIKLGR